MDLRDEKRHVELSVKINQKKVWSPLGTRTLGLLGSKAWCCHLAPLAPSAGGEGSAHDHVQNKSAHGQFAL